MVTKINMSVITIKVKGVKNLVKDYSQFRNSMKDMTEPLEMSSKSYLNVIHTNFKDEGRTFNQPWPPLSPITIKEKQALRKKGQSIGTTKPLLRTGALRKSFEYDISSKLSANIVNNTEYALIHQEGGKANFHGRSVQIPQRILADVDAERVNMVGMIFEKWLKRLVDNYKM